MRRIAIYGKGGIGKSTTASNISAAMAEMGLKVIQIGCDPKSDSTRFLMNGRDATTVLGSLRSGGTMDEYVLKGYNGVLCIECGGPRPGTGCAGRGIIAAFEELERQRFVDIHRPDVVIYDVLGDVVCGGFAMPIRNGYARDVFIVTSGENMSLYAAENIAEAVHDMRESGYARLSGVIQNSRGIGSEDELVLKTAERIGSKVICRIPRDPTVQECEAMNMTVMEGAPDSLIAGTYRHLAQLILNNSDDSEGGLRVG